MNGGTDPNEGTEIYQASRDIDAAMTTLRRLGLSAEADQIVADAAVDYSSISNDSSRSDAWKLQQAAKAYISAWVSLAAKLTAAANRGSVEDNDDAATVFGIKGLSGDPASLTIGLRDAKDRLANVNNDSVTLQRILASATRSGDETMAHAVVEAAVGVGDLDTVNAFIADRPALSAATERLFVRQHRKLGTMDFGVRWRLNAFKPAALAGKQDFEIQQLAAGQATAGSWNPGTQSR